MTTKDQKRIGLPIRPFLYTVDQLAVIFDVSEEWVLKNLLYFQGRSTGVYSRNQMLARNISPPNVKPEWRVAENELIRFLKSKGYKHYEKSYLRE